MPLSLISTVRSDSDTSRSWRGQPRDARNVHAVRVKLFKRDVLKIGDNVRVEIERAGDLVDELGGHGFGIYDAASVLRTSAPRVSQGEDTYRLFDYDTFPRRFDFRDGKSKVQMSPRCHKVLEAAVVPACDKRTALN